LLLLLGDAVDVFQDCIDVERIKRTIRSKWGFQSLEIGLLMWWGIRKLLRIFFNFTKTKLGSLEKVKEMSVF